MIKTQEAKRERDRDIKEKTERKRDKNENKLEKNKLRANKARYTLSLPRYARLRCDLPTLPALPDQP